MRPAGPAGQQRRRLGLAGGWRRVRGLHAPCSAPRPLAGCRSLVCFIPPSRFRRRVGTAEPRRAPGQCRQGAGVSLAAGKAAARGEGRRRSPGPWLAPGWGSLVTPVPQTRGVPPQGARGGSIGYTRLQRSPGGERQCGTSGSRSLPTPLSPPPPHPPPGAGPCVGSAQPEQPLDSRTPAPDLAFPSPRTLTHSPGAPLDVCKSFPTLLPATSFCGALALCQDALSSSAAARKPWTTRVV